ncbi:murein biosynthesis integral membrane protein MurJ [Labrys monachus]|uniref:Probable lipid II flippase MurJ n=1 Tax=Labrys monachus TaxID=217067 RepID=A0ABU0F8V1_9HYPH|nr:murein biosynthesis integral membrane protein MurJ [Labrys monachus]MDQ0391031.1 putative peptidoglycan lipid II flippase [Labrys monachus]
MRFLRNAASVGFATLFSRILGFVRDTMVAAALGAGPVADAFVVAFRLPSLMRRLLAEGAVNTAFVPLYGEAEQAREGQAFSDAVFTQVGLLFLVVTALALPAMPLLIRAIAPGFAESGGRVALAVVLSRITFAYCLATALTVVASAVLNVHGRFTASAYAPSLLNVVTILALLAASWQGWREEALARLLAWSLFAGGIAQGALVFAALRRAGLGLRFVRPRWTPPVRRFFLLALPGVAAGGVTQVNAFVGLVVASPEPGAVTWLYYADRVYQLPLGIVAVALGSALLPELAHASAMGDEEAECGLLSRAAEFALFLSLPAALALIVLARPIVSVLFERGAFQAADAAATALALAGFAAGLPAFVGAKVLQPLFFARTRMRVPFLIGVAGVVTDVVLSVALFPVWHQTGIALAAAASGWINLVLLAVAARWEGLLRLDVMARRRLPRLLLAAGIMAITLWLLMPFAQAWTDAGLPVLRRIAGLAVLCGGGLAAYLAACLVFGGIDRRFGRQALASEKPPPR